VLNPFSRRSAILIRTATIGYARQPSFEVNAPDAPSMNARIASSMLYHPTFREALEMEGVVVDERLLRELEGEGRGERGKGKGIRRRDGEGERRRRMGMLRDLSRL
jgi:peroxisomal coenzyme A diphosphatase NUDT7